jgi:hypothetical protein
VGIHIFQHKNVVLLEVLQLRIGELSSMKLLVYNLQFSGVIPLGSYTNGIQAHIPPYLGGFHIRRFHFFISSP